jgi:hypothetical protein
MIEGCMFVLWLAAVIAACVAAGVELARWLEGRR